MREPFETIVAQHGPTVLRVCRAVAGPDADDAWVETFLAALRAWPELPEDTVVEAYLVRIARNKSIDQLRARARRPDPVAAPPDGISTLGNPGAGESGIWQQVAALPERQRLALAYHYLGGLTHRETAELIGGSPESVRRAAADGIARLRRDR